MPNRSMPSPYRNAVCKQCDTVTRHVITTKGKAKPRCTCLTCNAYFKIKK